ncbi:kinesin-II 95 kDa subunit-like isoform X2 [Silurus meridionalis]|uniref:kinesin-II 95 kDa subunit-like isoform X2 n=1 Tax=Silurus meridionalis TaxID=175797 RepID=UPI001EEA63B1|nr:kinesin-II 95 kDa subunit-like isoform X2 [Silurus meridionalis]
MDTGTDDIYHHPFCSSEGQTGSGKTFTMLGPNKLKDFSDELRGDIPRSIEHLFLLISREVEKHLSTSASQRAQEEKSVCATVHFSEGTPTLPGVC